MRQALESKSLFLQSQTPDLVFHIWKEIQMWRAGKRHLRRGKVDVALV